MVTCLDCVTYLLQPTLTPPPLPSLTAGSLPAFLHPSQRRPAFLSSSLHASTTTTTSIAGEGPLQPRRPPRFRSTSAATVHASPPTSHCTPSARPPDAPTVEATTASTKSTAIASACAVPAPTPTTATTTTDQTSRFGVTRAISSTNLPTRIHLPVEYE